MSDLQDPEEIFPPKPGGMVDTIRKQRAEVDAIVADAESETTVRPKPVVCVDQVPSDVFGARTFVMVTGGSHEQTSRRILGADPKRKRAVVITLDEAVVVAISQAQADDPRNASNVAGKPAGGFVLPVNTPFVIEGNAEVHVAATSSTATRVSVWSESKS